MGRKNIDAFWDRNNVLNVNDNFVELYKDFEYTFDLKKKSEETIKKAIETNKENKEVQKQLNGMVIESGNANAEVSQARGNYTVLNERLKESDYKLNNTQRVINIVAKGAKGDGKTDNYQIIQDAIIEAEQTNSNVYIPGGEYFVSKTLRTAHKTTPHYTTGIRIFGDGKTSVLKGNGVSTVDYSDLTKSSKDAVIALHGGNNIVENLELTQCTVGIFFGQHPDVSDSYSSVSFNIIENIWMEYVGTGILMVHSMGNNYNKFQNIHILSCQIGVHLGKGVFVDRVNNNRNNFKNIRVSTGWIGYLIEEADGNSFDGVYGENIVKNEGIIGEQPKQLPEALNGRPTAIVVLDGQMNFFDKVGVENCAFHLYSVGFRTSFENMMVKDDVPNSSLIMFPNKDRMPYYYYANSTITPYLQYQPTSGVLHSGSNGAGITSRLFDMDYHWQSVKLETLTSDIASAAFTSGSKIRRLGGMVTWQANYRFAKDSSVGENSPIKIKIPFSDKLKTLENLYTNEVSSLTTMSFPIFVGVSGNLEHGIARFSTKSETSAYGAQHLIINPPSNGWLETSQLNNLIFTLSWYNE